MNMIIPQFSILNSQFLINIFCLLLFFCESTVIAQEEVIKQEYSHRRYSVSDGFPENFCWDVFQDSKGYIWVATYNGFARYDGQQIKTYWQDKQTNVQAITENREGNITALSFGYYAVLDPVADTLKLIYNTGWSLIPYVSQNMPTGHFFYESTGKDRQVALFQVSDTGLVKTWEHECLNEMDDYRKPYWDKENRKFYIPTKNYIYIVNDETGIVQGSIVNQYILTVFPYGKSIGALGTDGIYKYENGKFTRIHEKIFVPNPSGIQAITDRENRLLIRDVTDMYRFDGITLEHIFNNIAFFNILFDAENNLWAATYQGLFNLFNLQFRNYTFVKNNTTARTLCADNEKVWIGTYNGYLYHVNNGRIEEVKTPRSADSYFQGVSARAENHLFFPGGYTKGDVLHFDGKKGVWLNLPSMAYSFVLPLPDHQILAGAYQGIVIYNYATGNVVCKWLRSELFLQPNCAVLNKTGKILLGGSAGITEIEGDSIRLMEDMPDDFLSCRILFSDRNGKVWATSSNNKLFSINGNNLQYEYTFEHPIRGVYVTKDNILIVLTLRGIHIKKNGQTDFIYYDKNNGFTGEKIPLTQLVEDPKGNIWFLADKSVVSFNPNELLLKQNAPKLHIQQLMTSKDNINWVKTDPGISKFRHNNNNFKVQYIGIHYAAIENVRYYYRLKGFQDEWSAPTKQREITFNNLPPGDYLFEIYADAGTDESRTEIQSFAFSIKPAFWQTVWFFIAGVTFLILIVTGVALHIQRRKNKALLEKLRVEKELNELRISSIRLKAIPHFNANVLAAIEYYIANRTKEEAMRILGIYSDFTYKTLSEVDKSSRTLDEELAYVKMYLDLEKIRFLEKFDFDIKVEENVDKSVQLPNMILHTYCENAVKHGLMPLKSGGMLTINVSQHNSTVSISVEDNGVGRSYAIKHPQPRSTKQGLTILNRQIEIYNRFNHEKINQRIDDLEVGTRFVVEVPVGFAYVNSQFSILNSQLL
jgi:hypothetical protein